MKPAAIPSPCKDADRGIENSSWTFSLVHLRLIVTEKSGLSPVSCLLFPVCCLLRPKLASSAGFAGRKWHEICSIINYGGEFKVEVGGATDAY